MEVSELQAKPEEPSLELTPTTSRLLLLSFQFRSTFLYHVTPSLQKLHWLPVAESIRYYKLCLLAYKSLLEHAPEYISDLKA